MKRSGSLAATATLALLLRMRRLWRPPPRQTVSQWADAERHLSAESSPEPGKWRTERNEPARGPMDACTDPAVHRVVLMAASQTIKTEVILNATGYFMHRDPAPMLLVQPTVEIAEAFSQERIAPMLRDTPALQGLVKDARSRDSGNKILGKSFPGGHLAIAGANSPAGLAGRPRRIAFFDEVDRYPASAGAEGDPVMLGLRRLANFWNSFSLLASSPTDLGFSRIEKAWQESDQRYFYVPCPHCDEHQRLIWSQVRWPKGEPEKAEYVCVSCGVHWDDAARHGAVKRGEWRATAPFRGIAGFHISRIYSPWVKLADMAAEFLEAEKSPETLKTFINTALGELWEDQGQRVEAKGLLDRLEDWGELQDFGHVAPRGVLAVTAGVDVQDDRIEVERVGWGLDDESWSLDHRIFRGDPSGTAVWAELDDYLLRTTPTADGRHLKVMATAVDTGGHHTQAAYRFCRARVTRKVWAIKGVSSAGGIARPVWPKRANKNNKGKVLLFSVGVDAAKDAIMARLRVAEPGPGYCHFPIGREQAYFDQFGAETKTTKRVRGFPISVWVLRAGKRNEAIDLRAYAYAALQSLNISWRRVRARQDGRIKAAKSEAPVEMPAKAPTPRPAPPALPATKPSAPPPVRAKSKRRVSGSAWFSNY